MNVLITGALGNLGGELREIFRENGHDVTALDRGDLNICDQAAVETCVLAGKFDTIINAAAYNNVDACEDPHYYPAAFAVNVEGPKNLGLAAAKVSARLVHYSSDYVFAGDKPEGYTEVDKPEPISKYGETKLAGELAALSSGAQVFIVRLAKLFGPPGQSEAAKPSFVTMMLRLARTRPELAIVDEEVGTPTYTRDAALSTLALLESGSVPGIYHFINEGPGVTWFQFAEEFFSLCGIETPRHAVSSAEFQKPAKRPRFAPLKNTKFALLPERRLALREFLIARGGRVLY